MQWKIQNAFIQFIECSTATSKCYWSKQSAQQIDRTNWISVNAVGRKVSLDFIQLELKQCSKKLSKCHFQACRNFLFILLCIHQGCSVFSMKIEENLKEKCLEATRIIFVPKGSENRWNSTKLKYKKSIWKKNRRRTWCNEISRFLYINNTVWLGWQR